MAFSVYFKIERYGSSVSNGILVYEPITSAQRNRPLWPDQLDRNGRAETEWHNDWKGEEIDVYCHTDGINAGVPAFVARIKLTPGENYNLSIRR